MEDDVKPARVWPEKSCLPGYAVEGEEGAKILKGHGQTPPPVFVNGENHCVLDSDERKARGRLPRPPEPHHMTTRTWCGWSAPR